jgi:hypothetical protein
MMNKPEIEVVVVAWGFWVDLVTGVGLGFLLDFGIICIK